MLKYEEDMTGTTTAMLQNIQMSFYLDYTFSDI